MRLLLLVLLLVLPALGETPKPSPSPKAPPLKLAPASLVIPLGERRTATWSGPGTPQMTLSDPGIADVEAQGHTLTVTGLSSGDASLTLDFGEKSLILPLKVRARAVHFPSSLDLSLTGDKVGLEELKDGLERILEEKGALHGRARLFLSLAKPSDLNQGQVLNAQLSADGPDLLPSSANLTVRMARPPVTLYPAETLAVSNRPEKITGTGWLLDRTLPAGKPVRVLYHHRNLPGEPERSLEVLLRNNSAEPAKVHVILASVGPSNDEIYAGHLAASRFVQRVLGREGVYLTIPPGRSWVLDRLDLKPGQTVSGMALLTPQDSSTLRLQVRAVSESEPFQDGEIASDGGPVRTARGLYPSVIEAVYKHTAGGKYTYINLGEKPYLEDPETHELGLGNFGVLYRIRLLLQNRQAEPAEVQLGFQARGGPARGLIFVDGTEYETGMAGNNPLPVTKWTLEPGESKTVYLECFPQSGSNYPCSLVVSSPYTGQAEDPALPDPTGELPRYIP